MLPYPYRNVSKRDAKLDFDKFIALKRDNKMKTSFIGNATTTHYFDEKKVKTVYRNMSSIEFWKKHQKTLKRIAIQIDGKPLKDLTVSRRRAMLELNHTSISQFRPAMALYIYETFKPVVGILDFSAGWGGRMAAAMAYNKRTPLRQITYTGIDTNKKLKTPYKRMIKDFGDSKKQCLVLGKSETTDFSKLPAYDFVFTSPPYFTLEKYEHMPNYDSYYEWLNIFLFPVMDKCFTFIRKGKGDCGFVCVNISAKIYQDMRKRYGVPEKKILMPIRNRSQHYDKKKTNMKREYVYCWNVRNYKGK